LAYMAPEQRENDPKPQSDVFGLAAVLYEACTGNQPFGQFGWQPHVTLPPPIQTRNAGIEAWLSDLIGDTLAATEPERRFTPSAFLRRITDCAPVYQSAEESICSRLSVEEISDLEGLASQVWDNAASTLRLAPMLHAFLGQAATAELAKDLLRTVQWFQNRINAVIAEVDRLPPMDDKTKVENHLQKIDRDVYLFKARLPKFFEGKADTWQAVRPTWPILKKLIDQHQAQVLNWRRELHANTAAGAEQREFVREFVSRIRKGLRLIQDGLNVVKDRAVTLRDTADEALIRTLVRSKKSWIG
jgi:serine/threonine protein kinase